MYSYISGLVKEVNPKNIVLENNGIGYNILVANPYSYREEDTTKVFTFFNVREDEQTLYGFSSQEDRELFLDLISVKGVGPKTALLVSATTDKNDFIEAIKEEDIEYLSRFPKVGKRTAQQMILDLGQKYNKLESNGKNNLIIETLEALLALGYDKKNIEKVINQIDSSLKVEEQIKEALKMLIKR